MIVLISSSLRPLDGVTSLDALPENAQRYVARLAERPVGGHHQHHPVTRVGRLHHHPSRGDRLVVGMGVEEDDGRSRHRGYLGSTGMVSGGRGTLDSR